MILRFMESLQETLCDCNPFSHRGWNFLTFFFVVMRSGMKLKARVRGGGQKRKTRAEGRLSMSTACFPPSSPISSSYGNGVN